MANRASPLAIVLNAKRLTSLVMRQRSRDGQHVLNRDMPATQQACRLSSPRWQQAARIATCGQLLAADIQ